MSVSSFPLTPATSLCVAMNSVFLLCYAPRAAPIFWAAFWQSCKRGIVLSGARGETEAHFKVPGKRIVKPDDLLFYSFR